MPKAVLNLSELRELAGNRRTRLRDASNSKAAVRVLAEARRASVLDVLSQINRDLSKPLIAVVEQLADRELASGDEREVLERVIERTDLDDKTRDRLRETLATDDFSERLRDRFSTDRETPLDRVPELSNEMDRAVIADLTRIAGLSDRASESLLSRVSSLSGLSDQRVATLVLEDQLDGKEAERIGLVGALAQFVGGDSAAVERLVALRSAGGRAFTLESISDLLELESLSLGKAVDPELAEKDPAAAEAEGDALRVRIEERYPSDGLRLRLAAPDERALQSALKNTLDVVSRVPDALDLAPEDLELGEEQLAALAEVRGLINAHPGLALREIILGGESPDEIAERIGRRLKSFESFSRQNRAVDLQSVDFTPGSKDLEQLNFDGIADDDRDGVIGVLKARVRTLRVGGTVRNAAALMRGGFHSSIAIADSEPEEIARRSGISITEARIAHSVASDTRLSVANTIGTLVDELRWERPGFPWLPPIIEDITDGLRRLPGYEELFGDQSFCDCAHCDSILSPSAYFVDLMRFVDENVTSKDFTGPRSDHALKLENRRPDLWSVHLNCDSTHDLIPTLSIINEILETGIARRENPAIDADDRFAVEALVYGQLLPNAVRSFVTPFVRSVVEADRLLTDFATDRGQLVALLRPEAPLNERNAAGLSLSLPSYAMITTARSDWAYLQALYRMPFPRTGNVADPFDVQDVLRGMDIARDAFGDLVAADYVRDGDNIRILSQKRSSASVQNDIERVTGMRAEALDRAHRFWRLATALDWTPPTLDLVLARAGGALNDDAIAYVVAIAGWTRDLRLDADEALALVGPIPSVALESGDASLMDRLFNEYSSGADNTPFPAPTLRFVHPALRDSASLPDSGPGAGVYTAQRLRAAFGVTDQELLSLILMLAPALGMDPNATDEVDRGFELTENALSLLYRHALLKKALRLDLDELAIAVRFATGGAAVENTEQLTRLLRLRDELAGRPYELTTLGALAGIVPDPVAAGVFIDAGELGPAVIASISENERTLFAPTVFAFIDGISEDQSRELLLANEGLIELVERDMVRLRAPVGLGPALTAPDGGFPNGVTEAELQAVLDSFNLRRVLPEEVAAVLELSLEKLTALASYAGVDFSNEPLISAVAAGDPLLLITALEQVAQPLAAFRPGEVSADSVSFIAANPDVLAPGGATATERVRGMAAYVHALKEAGEEAASAIDAVMLAFTPANGFDAADTEQLAAATGTDAASVRIFAAGTAFPASASLALDTLRRVVGFAMDRQISADGMALLTSADAAALNEGAESLKASLQQRLGDSESFEAAIEGHEDYLRGQRRDALTDFMLRTSAGRFESRQDLYNYYLIDPSMEGCARTSRVVSAIGSVQTYVHRILLNLEQDRRDPDASNHVHVSPSRIPAGEWEWRKNYRVWEANRKVFLWPENYMLPELRDNKTPLFEELEKNLLQQEVNEQTVLDAYAAYLRGFEEVAGLRIAGAFHEHVWSEGRDVMHIFGCTADDPPAYYYWNIENLTFSKLRDDRRVVYSARRKIDVAIPVRDVSPTLYRNRLHIFWVEKSTAPWNRVVDGESQFIGYRHTLRLRFSFLRLDGSWTEPQAIEIAEHDGLGGDLRAGGLVRDPLDDRSIISADRIPKFADSSAQHYDYLEGYTLSAPAWQKVYPGVYDGELVIAIGARMFSYRVDMFERKAYRLIGHPLHGPLYGVWGGTRQAMYLRNENQGVYHQAVSRPNTLPYAPPGGRQDYVVSENALRRNIMGFGNRLDFIDFLQDLFNLAEGDLGAAVASVSDPEVRVMAPMSDWGFPAMFVQKETDASLLSQSFDSSGRPYQSRRLGTTVIGDMSRKLFYGGVSELLSKSSQLDFGEKTHLLTSANFRTSLIGRVGVLDYTGPLGAYFRELFMHIPALLAAHQNARGDFAAAQGWYQTIFDPTASFDSSVDLGSLSPSARLQAERDRVWQYAEFQGMSPPTLRDILTDEDAQESYRKDPFNPYAIARLRLSAFQKNIVMRYVDNLLDWADSLFRIFQRETVDEAHILYDLASQILGPRPADVGDCGEGVVRPRTYRGIQPHLEANQEFLIEVENYVIHGARRPASLAGSIAQRRYINVETADVQALELRGRVESRISSEIRFDSARAPDAATRVTEATRGATERMLSDDLTVADLDDELTAAPELPQVSERVAAENRLRDAHAYDGTPGLQMDWHHTDRVHMERAHTRVAGAIDRNWRNWREVRPDRFSFGLVRQVGPVFCVPRNKDLLALWDRVEDRLFKIRNCRNIDGDRVDLALFAPEIDPLALVRARAAGLSLSDILGSLAGNLPPYRFSYLISKAREYTGQVQSFGSRLLSAMERRDGEELARLRLTQAINMQNLVTKIRENELKIAEENLAEVQKREEELQYRKEFLEKSISTDLLPWERAEQILKHSAVASKILGAGLKGTAGVFYLLPQIGSPFSMKYGGEEFGHSAKEWGEVFKDTGTMLDLMAKSAGVEAKYEKRRKEWKHALKLEEHQLKQIEKRITAAEIRVSIARKALANHEQSIKDQEELLDFYESKFAGVEFYTWTASTLQSLYRQAFNAAFSMAQLTERAYRFERPSDSAQLLELSYWEPGQAGLLSGEKLAIDLQAMEKRYIETNYRTLEVTQPFSLRELDPAALLALRSTGECSYTIPEFAFDLLYPGHYRRRIRSVHLTLVRESEPFVNVPVTLRLTGSKIRVEPTQDGAAGLSDSQLRHTVQVATSSAQNDAGVFDFSLSDSRYLPFEGAGAVDSAWNLSLPRNFRPFDYDSIQDVILHISYSAESDGVLRDHVESDNAALDGAIAQVLSDNTLARAFSLREEFDTVLMQILNGPAGAPAVLSLDLGALPLPLRGREQTVTRSLLLLKTADGIPATGTVMGLNGVSTSGFTASPEFPGYQVASAPAFAAGLVGDHQLRVTDAGDLAPPVPGVTVAFDPGVVEDIVVYVELSLD